MAILTGGGSPAPRRYSANKRPSALSISADSTFGAALRAANVVSAVCGSSNSSADTLLAATIWACTDSRLIALLR